MAPDLNSVPPSPRPDNPSSPLPSSSQQPALRRISSQMQSPALASPTMSAILPSDQSAVAHPQPQASSAISSTMASPLMSGDDASVTGPGPLRHPRPLTAADLHMQLEAEQEAIVNRLSRELSILRATQNSSVVSNTSSTSITSALPDSTDHHSNHLLSGASHPTPTRRHQRSGSSTSTRSVTGASVTNNNIAGVAPERHPRNSMNRHDSNPFVHSLAAASHERISISRQNSINSSRRSGASSPVPSEYFPNGHPSRGPLPAQMNRERSSSSTLNLNGEGERERAVTSVSASARHDELAMHKHELEVARKENDMLRKRIKELENALLSRRESDASAASDARGQTKVTEEGEGRQASV